MVVDVSQRLLDAAIRLLESDGYARITTRSLVAEAGTHLPSVNYHFGSKDALLREAVAEALRRWGASTMAAIDVDAHAHERVDQSVATFVATLRRDRGYVVAAAEAFAQAERDEVLRGRLAESYQQFREIVARGGQKTRDVEPVSRSAEVVAALLIALFDGLAIQWLLDPVASPDASEILTGLDRLAALRRSGESAVRTADRRTGEHTFVFADLAGYTAFTETHGDDAAAQAALAFVADARRIAATHNAHFVKSMGDGVLLAAHTPTAGLCVGLHLAEEVGARAGANAVRVGIACRSKRGPDVGTRGAPGIERAGPSIGAA